MKLWLIFPDPGERLVGMLLSSAPLWWGMTGREKRGNRREMRDTERGGCERWSGEGRAAAGPVVILQGVKGCQRPCNPPAPLPSYPLYHPLHLTMTNRICSLSKSHRLPLLIFSFLTQWSSSHLSFTLPRSWSAHRDRLSLPGLAAELIGLARRSHWFPQQQHLESHLMGLGTFANLSTSFGCGARCQAGWSGTWQEGISIGRPFLEPWVKSNSKAFAYLTLCALALEAVEFNAEWLTNRLMC